MARYTNLADRLREYGCNVVEVAGWKERGSSTFNPQGVVAHHTAGPAHGDAPSLGICISGRPDVPGPLAHVVLSRSGICYVIASGRANHAGKGSYRGLSGNSSVFGIEAENTGLGQAWPAVQLEAYYRCVAAMLSLAGRDESWCCGHKEWAPSRKIDPQGIDMNGFRFQVGIRLDSKGEYVPTPPQRPGTLKPGDTGTFVSELQGQLKFWGHYKGAVDGDYGPATTAAVKSLQKALKVTQDGVYGPGTRKAFEVFLWNIAVLAQAKPRPQIGPGSKGKDVEYLQKRLNSWGAKPRVTVDGDFGPATADAVVKFKRAKKLKDDPVVGPVTWKALG